MTAYAYAELPALVKLRYKAQGFTYLPRQPIHSLLAGTHASRLRGRGLNFEEIRSYQPGDDVRSIDWKVTARTATPHVRVYTEERDRPVLMFVDQRLNMFFGSEITMKSVIATEAAAISAWRVLSVGDRPGGLVFNDSAMESVRPHRSEGQVLAFLNTMLRFNKQLRIETGTASNAAMLNRALDVLTREVTHDYLIVLISDMDGADKETEQRITRLAEHNDVLIVFVYDKLEADLPPSGRLVLSDGDLQVQIDSDDDDLRARFKGEFIERLQRAKTLLLRRHVPVLTLHTGRPVIEQIREQLGSLPGAGLA